jgi:hypothetical protein
MVFNIFSGAGDPFLAPDPTCVAESLIETMRHLHKDHLLWTESINQQVRERLLSAGNCARASDETALTKVIFYSIDKFFK